MPDENQSIASVTREDQPRSNRLLIKVTRESLPQVKDKYPFVYLERGRLEIDDSSVISIFIDPKP